MAGWRGAFRLREHFLVKICFICPEYPPTPHGGMGTFIHIITRALARAGHEVRVVGVYNHTDASPGIQEDEGVRIWRLKSRKRHLEWIVDRHAQYRMIRGWVAAGEIELVEAPDFAGWFAGWPRMPIPLIQRAHGSATYFAHELGRQVTTVSNRLEKWSYRRSDAWVAVSEHAARVTQRVLDLPHGADAVLYYPVDAPSQVPSFEARDPDRVVFTGTLTVKKGIVSIIDAWPAIKEGHPAARLEVYGKDQRRSDGTSMRDYLMGRLPDALRGSVEFHGHVSRQRLMQALQGARAAVFPSLTETFGLGPAEAVGCGCPTIYTKLSCGPEVVRDGVDGLLVDPQRPDEIAAAVLALLSDRGRAAALAATGRRRVLEEFGLDKVVRKNEEFYERIGRDFHRSGAARSRAYAID